jgi:hypothetical protein
MNRFPRARTALLLAALLAPVPAAAQETDATVPRRGMFELRATGTFTHFDDFLTAGRTRRPLATGLLAPLQEAVERAAEPVAGPVRDRLADFFAETGGIPEGIDPAAAGPGEIRIEASADIRTIPVSLAYGLTDRLSVELTVPLERRGAPVQARHVVGGGLGANPNPVENAEILGRLGDDFAALGGAAWLPTAGSPLGQALQARVQGLLGDTVALTLPARPVTLAELLASAGDALTAEERAALQVETDRTPYFLADAQIGLRFLLLPGPGGFGLPERRGGASLRTTVGVRGRLPTGRRAVPRLLLEVPSEHGHAGFGIDVANELFLTPRLYLGAGAAYDVRLPAHVQRLAFAADRPFPPAATLRTVRREPGARLALAVAPHFRLTDEISFAGRYAFARQAGTRLVGDDVLPAPAEALGPWTAHRWGIGGRYSTVGAHARGRTPVPLEFSLHLERTFAGDGGAPAATSIHATGRLFARAAQLRTLIPERIGEPLPGPEDTPPAREPAPEPPTEPQPPPAPPPHGSSVSSAPSA